MYFTQYAITDQDIAQHIFDEHTYPVKNQSGNIDVLLSRDVSSSEAISTIVQIHNLVEQNAKSEQRAVKFKTTVLGKWCLGFTLVGEALYQILLKPHRFGCPPNHQFSEPLNLWGEVLHEILDQHACFLGHPIRPMNDQGVTEGELVGAMSTRLGECVRRKAHQLAREERKKDAQRLYTARTKLVSRLLAYHSGVFGMRVELMYREDYAEKIRVKDSAEHIQGFIEALKDDPWFGQSVGNFWSRSFLSEAGYRTTLFLLFDPNATPMHKIDGAYLLQQWEESTKGAGLGFIRTDSFGNVDEILRYIECSKKAALYLRLKPNAKFPHFGMSELPDSLSLSELKQDPSTNIGDRGGFGWSQTDDLGVYLTNRFK